MNLVWWLVILGGMVFAVRLLDSHRRSARAAALSGLARAARMNYSAIDRFDLERRLQHSPAWTAGLCVRDVLYATRGDDRFFVATIDRRASSDDRPRSVVLSCAEPLDHHDLRVLSVPMAVTSQASVVEAYRVLIERLGQ